MGEEEEKEKEEEEEEQDYVKRLNSSMCATRHDTTHDINSWHSENT